MAGHGAAGDVPRPPRRHGGGHGRRRTRVEQRRDARPGGALAPRARGSTTEMTPGERDILLVVDVQNDFIPGGALAVAGEPVDGRHNLMPSRDGESAARDEDSG